MKKILLITSVLFWVLSQPVCSQEAPQPRPKDWSVFAGLGILSAADLLDRNLSQDLDGYDNYQYRMGICAGVNYRLTPRWSASFIWNRGGAVATKSSFSHGKYKKKTTLYNSYSIVLERRFALSATHYFYWGIGLGTAQVTAEKTPVSSKESIEKTTTGRVLLQVKPIGVCYDVKRVKSYVEIGLISLPLVTAGIKVQL